MRSKLAGGSTRARTEIFAGITTFMTMSYIVFANPAILAMAGMPAGAVQTATCASAAVACILMGLFARYPFALAPGMGLNAFLAYTVCQGMGYSWQTGMAVVAVEGAIITVLVVLGLRRWIMDAMPMALKHAIGVGIGLFIAFIGLKQGGIVVGSPVSLVTMGDLTSPEAVVTIAGLLFTFALLAYRVPGALLWGMAGATILGDFVFRLAPLPASLTTLVAAPDFSTFGGFAIGLREVFTPRLLPVVFAFLITDFFDTMGTVIAVGSQAGFVDGRGRMPRLGRVLFVDSVGAMLGGIFGASSVTTYIESASGVAAGGRRGLTAVTVGILFLVAMFLNPLAAAIPSAAVAPALIAVGFLMMAGVGRVAWHRLEEGAPAFLVILLMPLTFSISTGVGWGVLAYVGIMALHGKIRSVHPVMWLTAALFAVAFSPLVPR
jgi:AGZA family xanthine/uracil permease-like MFS transporter